MEKLIVESFSDVEAVWGFINPLQTIRYEVVGDIDPAAVRRKYM